MLYEVAIIQNPTQKERDEGKTEKLIMPPKPICATKPQTAAILATKEIDLSTCNPDLLEVLVRPFVKR